MTLKNIKNSITHLLTESVNSFIADNGLRLSASLSYYTIFSLPPLLIIIISICGVFFGAEAVRGEIFGQINGLMGNEAALQIQEAIKNVSLSKTTTFATTLGVVLLLIGASGVFAEIQDSINFIWGIKAKPKRGFMKFIKNRLLSFSMIGSVGFLLLVGLIVNSIMDILNEKLTSYFPHDTVYLFYFLNLVLLFVIITLLFTIIFKSLPDGKVVLKDCLIGASFTSCLFMIGKFAIGAYLGGTNIGSTYGAAGSVILILVWVYYSAIILYVGAEFTKVYAEKHGDKIIPNAYTVRVMKKEIEIE
jgi:membrane protein